MVDPDAVGCQLSALPGTRVQMSVGTGSGVQVPVSPGTGFHRYLALAALVDKLAVAAVVLVYRSATTLAEDTTMVAPAARKVAVEEAVAADVEDAAASERV